MVSGTAPFTSPGTHLLLYDDACGLCNGAVTAILRRDRRQRFHFAALQSDVATAQMIRLGRSSLPTDTVVIIANYQHDRPTLLIKARAALFAASELGWPWRATMILGLLPDSLLNRGYDLVARHRYRVFGRRDHCALPRPEYRSRFVDGSSGLPL